MIQKIRLFGNSLHQVEEGGPYPKAAWTGPYARAQEVTSVNGKVVAKYTGIVQLPEKVDVVERGGEESSDKPGQSQQIQR